MNKAQQERVRKIQQAMLPLIGDVRFQSFMDEVQEQQKAAVLDACTDRIVSSDRLTIAALGEVRAYEGLISFYLSQVDSAQQVAESQAQE